MKRLIITTLIALTPHYIVASEDTATKCSMAAQILNEAQPLVMSALEQLNSDTSAEKFRNWQRNVFTDNYTDAKRRIDPKSFPQHRGKYALVWRAYGVLNNTNSLVDDIYYFKQNKTNTNKNRIKIKTDYAKKVLNEFNEQCPTNIFFNSK